ncbi:four-helix bundle copper-binding protein [Streptomyces longwoodensis]
MVCTACGAECASRANMHEHRRTCAEACRSCASARNELACGLGL